MIQNVCILLHSTMSGISSYCQKFYSFGLWPSLHYHIQLEVRQTQNHWFIWNSAEVNSICWYSQPSSSFHQFLTEQEAIIWVKCLAHDKVFYHQHIIEGCRISTTLVGDGNFQREWPGLLFFFFSNFTTTDFGLEVLFEHITTENKFLYKYISDE